MNFREVASTSAPGPSPVARRCHARRPSDVSQALAGTSEVCIDAGVGQLRAVGWNGADLPVFDVTLPSDGDLRTTLLSWSLDPSRQPRAEPRVVITGKLAPLVSEALACGATVLPAAAAWLAAGDILRAEPNPAIRSLAVVEISASGYLLVGVDRCGSLKGDLLLVNPRCGAGSGINLDRVLQKLGLGRGEVDALLGDFAGDDARDRRSRVPVRADRCGVFGTSATVSDKNQGIPLAMALATTLKSEVLKACRKLPRGFDKVCLVGRVFHWRFARDCAEDWLRDQGVQWIDVDPDNTQVLTSLRASRRKAGAAGIAVADTRLLRRADLDEYPALAPLKERYESEHRFLRQPDLVLPDRVDIAGQRLHLALDVGSTMAKAVLAGADSGEILWLRAHSNAGDTLETIRQVFRDLASLGHAQLDIRGIGITGSARFQVQQALERIYPELTGRVIVLVENYAHARGSIALARDHVRLLKAAGAHSVNEHFCILVDVGGEDTKVSTVALREAELFGNAMNLKCSAGTGSLMDTLVAMFGGADVASACAEALAAPKALAINATCAVFLMENARKLQLQGVPRDQIYASANWAIVENMARSLWNQLQLPSHAVVLMHGQTMLSDPLPVAVTHRMQSFGAGPSYALVPPNPGHRACFGLVNTLRQCAPAGSGVVDTARFLNARFEKRLVQCRGAACDDKAARCNRSCLTCRDSSGRKLVSFTVGGCSAINELPARKKDNAASAPVRDTYKEIWDFIDSRHPRSTDPGRIVIPRSFAVSEWACLLATFLARLGLPVHVDNVVASDLADAQPLFSVDTCAPHMGAVGQYRRLAGEPHGLILAPQIEALPTDGKSTGHTCTLNQGGVAVAVNLARLAHPEARFLLFNVDLSTLEPEALRIQFELHLQPLFRRHGLAPGSDMVRAAAAAAVDEHRRLCADAADLAATVAEEALAQGTRVAVVVGREYVLNPGIFDSHVRRLLRDKHMVVLPSYVLDVELNEDYAHIYWRNPHLIVSLLDAISRRQLHRRVRNARLREVFRLIEQGPDLLPVVQISTFSCGPDSVVQPFIAEIMRQRPFLLIQSDAVIKELAHLENRVNTYVRQLELGLHQRLRSDAARPFEIRALDDLANTGPVDRATDVIYFPTMGDNRPLTATLRGAGFTCIDNYDESDYDLHRRVRAGRRSCGDAVCAPLAAVYADLELAVQDFDRRRKDGDAQVAGKQRLLYFDNKGPGPCRQGQYFDTHRLLFDRDHGGRQVELHGDASCAGMAGNGMVRFLVGLESSSYDIGVGEWVLARAHQAGVLHGVLQSLHFAGGAACRDFAEYEHFLADFHALKAELHSAQESFHGPEGGRAALLGALGRMPWLSTWLKYNAYQLSGKGLVEPLRRFSRRWIDGRVQRDRRFRIALTGEVYMRVSQSEEIFRLLLANLGFRRFEFDCAPLWSYLDYVLADAADVEMDRIARLQAAAAGNERSHALRTARAQVRASRALQLLLRHGVARPLYRAAGVPMPAPATQAMRLTQELLPTLRPRSEIATYTGEAIGELRHGADLLLNVGPCGCMVATMGEALTPAIARAAGPGRGRIQHLFSADGDVNEELLTLAVLKAMGPEDYYRTSPFNGEMSAGTGSQGRRPSDRRVAPAPLPQPLT